MLPRTGANNSLMHEPYLISFHDGEITKSFFLNDYKNAQDMIISCFDSLFNNKYNGYKVYVHNLANFDSIFIIGALAGHCKMKPIMNNGRLVTLGCVHRKR